jgi:tRNA A-37 threonylcarbamoyl transferase component Bud32
MKQLGGLKLKDEHKQGFQPVYEMLTNPRSIVTLLNHSSLKGFMFVLNVHVDDSEYFTLHEGKFVVPVTSFILKFTVIKPSNNTHLEPFMPTGSKLVKKLSESKKSCFEEAKLQQYVWKKSVSEGRQAICPSVANFSLFDNTNSTLFMMFLNNKVHDQLANEVLHYLIQQMRERNSSIGLIVMPNIERSVPFSRVLKQKTQTESDKKVKYSLIAQLSAQIVRLFIEVGVIHLDLHSNNVLIFDDNSKCLIIDFGRASDIHNGKDDDLKLSAKLRIIDLQKKYSNEFLKLSSNDEASDEEKRKFMVDVIKEIADVDYLKYQTIFSGVNSKRGPTKYQMFWLFEEYLRSSEEYLKPREEYIKIKMHIPLLAYEMLVKMMTVHTPSADNIDDLERKRFLIDFSKDIPTSKFLAVAPESPAGEKASSSSVALAPRTEAPRTPGTAATLIATNSNEAESSRRSPFPASHVRSPGAMSRRSPFPASPVRSPGAMSRRSPIE